MKVKSSDLLLILVGTFIVSIGVTYFYSAANLVTGGVTGLAIIIENITTQLGVPIPLWLTNLALNIPLLILGWFLKGKDFIVKTMIATFALSFWLFIMGLIPTQPFDLFLSSFYGAVLNGVGLALVFKTLATTGGTDLFAYCVNHKFSHLPVTKILFAADSLIVLLGAFMFGATKTMYAFLAIFITTKVISYVLEGFSFAKAVYIISDEHEKLSERIMHDLKRGGTLLNATGMYTNNDKKVILCAISTKQIVKLKSIVNEVDKKAFILITDAREIHGEGFSELK